VLLNVTILVRDGSTGRGRGGATGRGRGGATGRGRGGATGRGRGGESSPSLLPSPSPSPDVSTVNLLKDTVTILFEVGTTLSSQATAITSAAAKLSSAIDNLSNDSPAVTKKSLKRPRGKAPKNKEWDYSIGEWRGVEGSTQKSSAEPPKKKKKRLTEAERLKQTVNTPGLQEVEV